MAARLGGCHASSTEQHLSVRENPSQGRHPSRPATPREPDHNNSHSTPSSILRVGGSRLIASSKRRVSWKDHGQAGTLLLAATNPHYPGSPLQQKPAGQSNRRAQTPYSKARPRFVYDSNDGVVQEARSSRKPPSFPQPPQQQLHSPNPRNLSPRAEEQRQLLVRTQQNQPVQMCLPKSSSRPSTGLRTRRGSWRGISNPAPPPYQRQSIIPRRNSTSNIPFGISRPHHGRGRAGGLRKPHPFSSRGRSSASLAGGKSPSFKNFRAFQGVPVAKGKTSTGNMRPYSASVSPYSSKFFGRVSGRFAATGRPKPSTQRN